MNLKTGYITFVSWKIMNNFVSGFSKNKIKNLLLIDKKFLKKEFLTR